MPPAADRALVALARRTQDVLAHLSNTTATAVGSLWDRYGGLTDEAMADFAARAARVVAAAQQRAATAGVRYIETYVAQADGEPWSSGIDPQAAARMARAGTPVVDVYRRPTITARAAIARGRDFEQAMAIARARAVSAANTDVALAFRAASSATMQAHPRVVGYRRIPDANACRFCLTASTQRYHVGDLMPMHNYCHCITAPIVGDRDPGHIIDRDLLERLKATSNRSDYWRGGGRIVVREHGELGPVLVDAADAFDDLSGGPPEPTPTRPDRTKAPIDVLEWDSTRAEREFRRIVEELGEVHGLDPADQMGPVRVRWGGKTQRKGGHFAPNGVRAQVKRKRGEASSEFYARRAAAARADRVPEILVNDTGDAEHLVSFLHEFGHRVDYFDGGYLSSGAHGRVEVYPQATDVGLSGWDDFFGPATKNDHYAAARQRALRSGSGYYQYFNQRAEVWARAYAQWSARQLGGDAWAALDVYRTKYPHMTWPDDIFDRDIAPQIEKILRARGLMR